MRAYTIPGPMRPAPVFQHTKLPSDIVDEIRMMVASGLGWEDIHVKFKLRRIHIDPQTIKRFVIRGQR